IRPFSWNWWGGATEMLAPLYEQYVETTQPLVEELLAALGQEDFETARKKAHSCAGASKTAGAMRFGAMCSRIEKAIVQKDFPMAKELGGFVGEAFAQVVQAIQEIS
ncbi:MAG: Hpt domain-containing protein, partial [Alphaproteobacteria bacterium]